MTDKLNTSKSNQNPLKCLIIAAGQGSRLHSQGDSKPLTPVCGIPLIERVITTAMKAGAEEFFIVTGFCREPLERFLRELSLRLNLPITPIENKDWKKSNGVSVLKGRPFLRGPFLLLMSDHLFDPGIVLELISRPLSKEEIALATDADLANPLVDMDDVTRVKTDNGKIVSIGKGLKDYDCFDTGVFFCGPILFEAIERCQRETGDASLSAAVQKLSREKRAKSVDVSGRFWIDIDDPASFQKAEKWLDAEIPQPS